MDKVTKALRKLSEKERQRVKTVLAKFLAGKTAGLDVKKLKDRNDVFRVRIGDLRIIYRMVSNQEVAVLSVSRRNENTYKI